MPSCTFVAVVPRFGVRRCRRFGFVLAALTFSPPCLVGGCGSVFGPAFAAGTYSADLPCEIHVVGPSGAEASETFTSPVTWTVDADGSFLIDGAPLVVGQQVLRSIPTADLAFEITKITRRGLLLTVEYAPRPSLPGIRVEGALVETYRWRFGSIAAEGRTNLEVTDVSGTSIFKASCAGLLTPRA